MTKEDSSDFSNDDILGGLKAAIERGETLKDAMMSFYNAGYSKEDIEEAARRYMMESSETEILSASSKEGLKKVSESVKKEEAKKVVKAEISSSKNSDQELPQNPKGSVNDQKSKGLLGKYFQPKKISDYGVPKKKKWEKTTVILVALLLFLILVLGVVFLFKQELIDLFNKWLG